MKLIVLLVDTLYFAQVGLFMKVSHDGTRKKDAFGYIYLVLWQQDLRPKRLQIQGRQKLEQAGMRCVNED